MSDYQPRAQGGWPAQPPAQGPGQAGHGRASYGKPGYGPNQYGQAGPGPQAGPPPRRRRRHRGLIALVVVLVILVAAAVIGDQVAKSYAQNRVAEQIQTSGLNTKPAVSIEGWPFLTQIAAHNLRAVDISANNATADSGKLSFDFTAKATGVHLNSSFNGATVDNINGRAVLPFSSVDGLLPMNAATMSADPSAGPNAVKVDAGIAGSVTGTVKQSGPSQIVIQLNSGTGLASLFDQLAGHEITITIPQLPAGLVVRSVGVSSQGIVATASASHTTLSK